MNIKKRYNYVPQMKFYDQISCDYKPFVMFFNKSNFTSNTVNTDELGFRYNYHNGLLKKQSQFYNCEEVSIVLGGSSVFGFGTTLDNNTISSKLTKKTNQIYLNFGATAFNSKQELILFLNFFQKFKKIKNVIIVSGMNDLYINLTNKYDVWGNFFFKNKYNEIHEFYKNKNNIKSRLKKLISKLLKKKQNVNDYTKIDFDNLDLDFKNLFNLWSSLSISYKFNLYYYLQPLPSWSQKKLSNSEINIFEILDNSDDFAHQILKEISLISNYNKYKDILIRNSNDNKINFFDLNTELKKINNFNESLFVDRVHLTDTGYDEISNIILDQI
jgi:lysophospholipase L1-like esterase